MSKTTNTIIMQYVHYLNWKDRNKMQLLKNERICPYDTDVPVPVKVNRDITP
jgi:hypothetical protein